MNEKTYEVVFEVESDRPAHEVAANIRAALESRGLTASGIDVTPVREGDKCTK